VDGGKLNNQINSLGHPLLVAKTLMAEDERWNSRSSPQSLRRMRTTPNCGQAAL
jgi:hypothetical protein